MKKVRESKIFPNRIIGLLLSITVRFITYCSNQYDFGLSGGECAEGASASVSLRIADSIQESDADSL